MNCALITGASKGIGRAIAVQIAREHRLHILINYSSDSNAAEETLCTIIQEGGSAELLKFNVANKNEVDSEITSLASDFVAPMIPAFAAE